MMRYRLNLLWRMKNLVASPHTETTGLAAADFVLKLAASGCACRGGEPFRKLLNKIRRFLPAARVSRLPRARSGRDGEPPHQVYREFAEYAGNLPLVRSI